MPGDQGPGVIAACVTVAALATIGVCLRFIARRIGGTRYGADDYLILAALVRLIRIMVFRKLM